MIIPCAIAYVFHLKIFLITETQEVLKWIRSNHENKKKTKYYFRKKNI